MEIVAGEAASSPRNSHLPLAREKPGGIAHSGFKAAHKAIGAREGSTRFQ
jgi:hypothetical protein